MADRFFSSATVKIARDDIQCKVWLTCQKKHTFSVIPRCFILVNRKYRKIQDLHVLQSFKEILAGKYDHLPEAAFYMQGDIQDVLEKAEQLAAQGS